MGIESDNDQGFEFGEDVLGARLKNDSMNRIESEDDTRDTNNNTIEAVRISPRSAQANTHSNLQAENTESEHHTEEESDESDESEDEMEEEAEQLLASGIDTKVVEH